LTLTLTLSLSWALSVPELALDIDVLTTVGAEISQSLRANAPFTDTRVGFLIFFFG